MSAGKFQAGMSARHVSQFWFLHAINSSLTPLRHLLAVEAWSSRGTVS